MTEQTLRRSPTVLCVGVLAMMLAGCSVEYHGVDSGIDGVRWRQIAAFEDPLSKDLFNPSTDDPAAYLDSLEGTRWDGRAASALDLGLDEGGIVLYEMSSTPYTGQVSVFIASGPPAGKPTDAGSEYAGPSEIYTCYRVTTTFESAAPPSAERTILAECPDALIGQLSADALFASAEVFDG